MKTKLNRKQFLALGLSAAAVTVVGCSPEDNVGGDGDGDGDMTGSGGDVGSGGAGNSGGATNSGGAASGGAASGGATNSGGSANSGGATNSGGDVGSGGDDAGSGGDPGSGGAAADACASIMTMIGTNHGHAFEMEVSPADVSAGVEKTYDIQGASPHPHTLTLTVAHFATIAADGSVTVDSSNDNGHVHAVTVNCMMP